MKQRVALVTGGNRGLGLETCRQLGKKGYKVILTARNEKLGKEKTNQLKEDKLDIIFKHLDTSDIKKIPSFINEIEKELGRLDVLINNAAILDESDNLTIEYLQEAFDINVSGPYFLSEGFAKLMAKHHYGRIVNVSSEMGQLKNMEEDHPAYRITKAALNAVTKIMAAKYRGQNILVNSISPGWVKTDMGGPHAPLSLEEGVDSILWAAELPDHGPTGSFFERRQEIAW